MPIRTVVFASLTCAASVACVGALAAACGGSADLSSNSPDASSGDGAITTVDTGIVDLPDGALPDSAIAASCPGSAPNMGDACPQNGTECEYGTSDLRLCNTVATCTSGTWHIAAPQDACANELDAGGVCPAAITDIQAGSPCPTFRQICEYPQGACGCGFVGHVSDQWVCDTTPGAGCPTPRPRVGTTCAPSGVACDYASCSILGGPKMSCTGGVWTDTSTACPP